MDRALPLIMLLATVPLAAGLWKRGGLVVAWVLCETAYVALVFILAEEARPLLLLQIPFHMVLFGVGYLLVGENQSAKIARVIDHETAEFDRIKARHAALKAMVAENEKEEIRSMQIYGVAKGLAEALSWKDLAPRLTAAMQKIFGSYEFLLYALDHETGWSLLHRRGNWSKEPPVVNFLPDRVAILHPPITSEVAPVLVVPVFGAADRRLEGSLFLKVSTEGFSPQELEMSGRDFGEQLGMALNKARLFTQMEMQSKIDGLTGVLRRQAFMNRLDEEIKRAAAFHTPFSVMMIDIDHFKTVNDSHGHAAGDAVLARLGQILKDSVYETDVIGRYGGEEFIVLLPRAQAEGVARKAEAIRRLVESEIVSSGFVSVRVTISIGLAHFPANGSRSAELIEAADKALYQAKETGRNRVVAA